MPFVPHTPEDERIMLERIGVDSIEALFDEIPNELRAGVLRQTPSAITEMELMQLMNRRARRDEVELSFIGAGAYEHHIPAAVWDLVSRGEFMTAYTPYQAEASQGTLQVIYEFQTMMSRLTGMDVANASVYEGGSALAEATLMAVRANKKNKSNRILALGTVNPRYLEATRNIVSNQDIEVDLAPWSDATGTVDPSLAGFDASEYAAIVIGYPNFFGGLEDVDAITDWAHAGGALVIGAANPMALALLRPPGEWGESGADIVVGDAQPFGIPVASGGPYCGFMCCTTALVRQMPGRIIGQTVDLDGRRGFALTLQAREQHIRRAKATSNICTNQGLLVTAATIYMSLMGDEGIASVASQCHQGLGVLLSRIEGIDGVSRRFDGPVFHEAVIRLPMPASEVLQHMAADGVLGGYDLGEVDPALADCMLTNVTEVRTEADLDRFAACLQSAVRAA
ncbi:MAG: aminomethyl-transferring glycine dehydrogenase subunit GcvPA [Pseudomonadales bacterium]|nr:aminomethyl-transferring glycine dehydrogenase subunit GcvPA [Pseudomonadales bacterium]